MRVLLLSLAVVALVQAQTAPPTIAQKTQGMAAMPGYFPLYYEAKTGKLFLEIPQWNTDFLYIDSLPAGVDSNDIGLDRGQIGNSRVVRFERFGPKIFLVQPNQDYRADTNDREQRQDVAESFAQSVLWGFTAEAEEGDRVLVDATAFFLRDAHGIPETLADKKQGGYSLDEKRSAIYPDHTKNFRAIPKSRLC